MCEEVLPGPDVSVYYDDPDVSVCAGVGEGNVIWSSDYPPAGWTGRSINWVSVSGPNDAGGGWYFPGLTFWAREGLQTRGQPPTGTIYQGPNRQVKTNPITSIGPTEAQGSNTWTWVVTEGAGADPLDCFVFRVGNWATRAPTAPYVLPPIVDAPPGIPPAPGCPTVTDFQGLANLVCDLGDDLRAINAKLDWLVRIAIPPTVVEDQTPVAAPNGQAVTKPDSAIGVAVELTSIPGYVAHYGNPSFYPDAAHLALVTDAGQIEHRLVRSNPMVVHPINRLVKSLVIDLSPGVTAQFRWLREPK